MPGQANKWFSSPEEIANVAKIFGLLAQAAAPGTFGARLGELGANIGSSMATNQAVQNIKSGKPVDVFTSPQELAMANQLVNEQTRTAAYKRMAEAQPTHAERIEEAKLEAILQKFLETKRPPDVFNAVTSPTGEVTSYFLSESPTAKGGYEAVEIASGKPAQVLNAEANRLRNADAEVKLQKTWYDKAIDIARRAVGKYVTNPKTGELTYTLIDPNTAQSEFTRIATDVLTKYAADGLIPNEWINNIPSIVTPQVQQQAAQSEVQKFLDNSSELSKYLDGIVTSIDSLKASTKGGAKGGAW